MLQHLDLCVLQNSAKVVQNLISMVGMDESESKEGSSLGVRAGSDAVLGKIWCQEAESS